MHFHIATSNKNKIKQKKTIKLLIPSGSNQQQTLTPQVWLVVFKKTYNKKELNCLITIQNNAHTIHKHSHTYQQEYHKILDHFHGMQLLIHQKI